MDPGDLQSGATQTAETLLWRQTRARKIEVRKSICNAGQRVAWSGVRKLLRST
jgi:hypothetical protein